jgi:large subunit ribosomal protein L21
MKFSVIKTGGKQYIVKANDEIYIDRLSVEKDKDVEFESLALFDDEKSTLVLGKPILKEKIKAKLIENVKADKIRISKFKSKVRYRKVQGYRHNLSKVKILPF